MTCLRLCIASVVVAWAIAAGNAVGKDPANSKVFSSPAEAVAGAHEGATVLWGGRIFDHENNDGKTCIGVVSFPLSRRDARPETRAAPGQIFYACSADPLDASDYAVGRQVAVAGKVGAVREQVVSRACTRLPATANLSYRGTSVTQSPEGCIAHTPVVVMTDGHTWPDPPEAHPPQFM